MGNGSETTMIVYVKDCGVLGVVLDYWEQGCVVKWYLDGIEFKGFLLEEEYIVYRQGSIGGMDVS